MNLLFLIESMSPEAGGPAIEVTRLTSLLVKENGMNVTVASITPKHENLPLDKKVNYFQFKHPSFPLPSWFKAIRDLKKLIMHHDVVFVTGIWGPVDGFALRLAWKKDKRIYIRICGMLEPYILARNAFKKRLGLKLYVRKNLKNAAGLIVNSSPEAISLRNIGVPEEKILVIPNGISISNVQTSKEEAKKNFGISPNIPVLLYLGRLHPKKGMHFLLKAIAAIPKETRQFKLLVAGEYCDAAYRSVIENLVQTLGLNEFILFTGFVSGAEKKHHFNAADCFILPSESEGLPNAVLEAMAHGLPAIITTGSNIPEIATYKAGLVIDLSIPNLTKAVEWFLSGNTSLKVASGNALRLIGERFSEEKSVGLYKKIIKGGFKNPMKVL